MPRPGRTHTAPRGCPHPTPPRASPPVRARALRQAHRPRRAGKRGQRIAVARIGVDQIPDAGGRALHGEICPLARARRIPPQDCQQPRRAGSARHARNAGRMVRNIRLKRTRIKRRLRRAARQKPGGDGLRMVAVAHDERPGQAAHRRVQNQRRVGQERRIKRARAHAVRLAYEHAVAAVDAAPRQKIRRKRAAAVRAAPEQQPASRIAVAAKRLHKGLQHGASSSQRMIGDRSCRASPRARNQCRTRCKRGFTGAAIPPPCFPRARRRRKSRQSGRL